MMLSSQELADQRPFGETEDVHFTESLAAEVITSFSAPGETVLDPFAGFGTTPAVAARLGRRAVAVELLAERASLIRQRTAGAANVITGDARRLAELVQAPVDLCLTSPPYMTATGHAENPLTGYQTKDANYATYLREVEGVFAGVASLLRPGGYAVINVANVVSPGGAITPLAWDIARGVSPHLALRQETFLCWDRLPHWLSADYCLAFQKPA